MEDPKAEITQIIHTLTQAPPIQQKEVVKKYFLPNASFQHPFCRTSSWNTFIGPFTGHQYNSRWAILQIYQWYKILSPEINLRVLSIAFDEEQLVLYVTIRQQFRIWLVYAYEADVLLTSVLQLEHGDESGPESAVAGTRHGSVGGTPNGSGRYYISAQNDLYQTSEWIKFLVPWGIGYTLVTLWQSLATLMSIVGACVFFPQTWWKQYSLGDWPPKKI